MEDKSMENGRCWHCGQPRTCQHETLTCGSEECVTAALKQQERIASKLSESKSRSRERMREYYQRPEVKAWRREYMREYQQRPEVKARQREYQRVRYHRLRAAQEEE